MHSVYTEVHVAIPLIEIQGQSIANEKNAPKKLVFQQNDFSHPICICVEYPHLVIRFQHKRSSLVIRWSTLFTQEEINNHYVTS